jgi:hypothetical protein
MAKQVKHPVQVALIPRETAEAEKAEKAEKAVKKADIVKTVEHETVKKAETMKNIHIKTQLPSRAFNLLDMATGSTTNLQDMQKMATRASADFFAMAPWLEEDFFWVRCESAKVYMHTFSLSIKPEPEFPALFINRVCKLINTEYREIVNPVIVRDGAQMSAAAGIRNPIFMSTAIMWHLITQRDPDLDLHDDDGVVANFMEYARENYVHSSLGESIVDRYPIIYHRITERMKRAAEAMAATAMRAQADKAAALASTTPAQCEIRDAKWSEEDSGLILSLYIPREMAMSLLEKAASKG